MRNQKCSQRSADTSRRKISRPGNLEPPFQGTVRRLGEVMGEQSLPSSKYS